MSCFRTLRTIFRTSLCTTSYACCIHEFKSGIWVEKEERRVNAKSLLGVLSLGIVKGTTITLIADGPDAKEAVEALAQLVDNQLGE